MNETIEMALANCLEAIERGECSLEECLERYPQHRQELRDLLLAAQSLRLAIVEELRPAFLSASKARLVARIQRSQPVTFWDWIRHQWQETLFVFNRRPAMSLILILTLIVALAGGGAVGASGGSLPGDSLYTLKTSIEDARLSLLPDEDDLSLYVQYSGRRVVETRELAQQGRYQGIETALLRLESQTGQVLQVLERLVQENPELAGEAAVQIQATLTTHLVMFELLLESLPEEALPAIENAMLVSQRGLGRIAELFPQGFPPAGVLPTPPDGDEDGEPMPGILPTLPVTIPTDLPGLLPGLPITPTLPTTIPPVELPPLPTQVPPIVPPPLPTQVPPVELPPLPTQAPPVAPPPEFPPTEEPPVPPIPTTVPTGPPGSPPGKP